MKMYMDVYERPCFGRSVKKCTCKCLRPKQKKRFKRHIFDLIATYENYIKIKSIHFTMYFLRNFVYLQLFHNIKNSRLFQETVLTVVFKMDKIEQNEIYLAVQTHNITGKLMFKNETKPTMVASVTM